MFNNGLIFEDYSDNLVFASRVLTQLQVNLYHHFHNWQELKEDSHADFQHNVRLIDDQIQQLEELHELAKVRFQTLLLSESSFHLQTCSDAPYVCGQPDWVDELFRYPKPESEDQRIKLSGGYVVSAMESGGQTWIDPSVPVSFIRVWYPVCGDFAYPGYLRFTEGNSWTAYSEEH